jgi:uncharacterized protein YqjF (DUF2071 family)
MIHPAFARIDHRPWPLPAKRWTWRQTWRDLLFMHWPMPASLLQPLVPRPLEVQEFDGSAWIGIVPFHMEGVTRRGVPAFSGLSAFPELNVRTYVSLQGKPGVWFLSLDAANRLAVWAARRFFHLPYFHAAMSVHSSGPGFTYQSRRLPQEDHPVLFLGSYHPISSSYEAKPGGLDHWLTERYCLYARSAAGNLYRTEVHHVPWPLQHAEADVTVNSMLDPHGLDIPSTPPVLHFARSLDVAVWPPEKLRLDEP